jgi:hypothetical protein
MTMTTLLWKLNHGRPLLPSNKEMHPTSKANFNKLEFCIWAPMHVAFFHENTTYAVGSINLLKCIKLQASNFQARCSSLPGTNL